MKSSDGKCLFPECSKSIYGRGLCAGHYQSAHRLVIQNKTTWKALEEKGKALKTIRGDISEWFLA
jgi:hypothetical protein